ncbi:hypothetical protein AnigIFM60653_002401 [Aspergillus niger]|nr:hypothetical protein AnigIFM60653_002401 [Aspergillus niger]
MSFHLASADLNLVQCSFVLTPKPGLIDEVCAELSELAKDIEDKQPGTLSFSVLKAVPIKEMGTDGPETVVVNVMDRDSAAAHRESPEIKAFLAKGKAEGKLACPPEMRAIFPIGGYIRQPLK